MLTFALVLAVISTVFEGIIAARSRYLRRLAGRRVSINLGVSLTVSLVLGSLFGAIGLIALTAGLLSTLMSVPVYRFLYWNFDSPKAVQVGGNRLLGQVRGWRQSARERSTRMRERLATAFRILVVPIRFARFCARLLEKIRSLRRH